MKLYAALITSVCPAMQINSAIIAFTAENDKEAEGEALARARKEWPKDHFHETTVLEVPDYLIERVWQSQIAAMAKIETE